jgi:hypothetical protein
MATAINTHFSHILEQALQNSILPEHQRQLLRMQAASVSRNSSLDVHAQPSLARQVPRSMSYTASTMMQTPVWNTPFGPSLSSLTACRPQT